MCADFWERAVCIADHISLLSSQLNSLFLDWNVIHNTPKFNLNLQDHWSFTLFHLSFKQKLYDYPLKLFPSFQPDMQMVCGDWRGSEARVVAVLVMSYILWRMKSTVGNIYTSCPLKRYPFLMSFHHLPLIKEKQTLSQTPPATLTAFYLIWQQNHLSESLVLHNKYFLECGDHPNLFENSLPSTRQQFGVDSIRTI